MPAYTAAGDTLGAARMALTLSLGLRGPRRVRRRRAAGSRTPSGCSRASPRRPSTAGCCSRTRITAMFAEGDLETRRRALRRALRARDSASATATCRCSRCPGRAAPHQGRRDRRGPRAARRGDRVGDVRRPAGALGRARLLHHDQLLPGPRRLPPRRRVDGGGEPLVRHARRHRLPGRVPDPPRRGACGFAATGRRRRRRRSRRAKSSRTSTAASPRAGTTRSARSGAGVATSTGAEEAYRDLERARARPAAGARAPAPRRGEGRRGGRRDHADARRRQPRIRSPAAPASRAGRDRDRRRRPQDGPRGRGRGRADRRLVQDRRTAGRRVRRDGPLRARARSSSPRRTGTARRTALQRARDEWQGVGAPYETARARLLLGIAYRRSGDEHAATVELEGALATFERLGARPDEAASEGAPRQSRGPTHLPVHGHRRLDEAARHARRREVEATARTPRRARARGDRRERRRGRQADAATGSSPRSRTRRPRSRRRSRSSARSRARSSRPTCGSARTRWGVPHGRRVERLRRPGRPRRCAHRRGCCCRRDPRQRETLDGVGTAFRLSEPRHETLKGVEAAGRGRLGRLALSAGSTAGSDRATEVAHRPAAEAARGAALIRRGGESLSSVGFVMNPSSTRITGTSAQLKP